VHIAWATLAAIAVVSASAALTVVLLVSFALVGWSQRSGQRVDGQDDGASATHPAPAPAPAVAVVVAGLCMVAAGLIVCYGMYLIIA
jgi:hypothetical protein